VLDDPDNIMHQNYAAISVATSSIISILLLGIILFIKILMLHIPLLFWKRTNYLLQTKSLPWQ
jgi:hypothetical protein